MVLAHGFGGAQDLPIAAEYAIAGAGAALSVSFLVLALAWRTPRYDAATAGRPVPPPLAAVAGSVVLHTVVRALGLAFFLYVAWAALAGPDLRLNPTFGVVYVLLWVGVVPASLLFGPFYRAVSPVRTLHLALPRLLGGTPGRGLVAMPPWVGYWPAAAGLFAFVWLELVYPDSAYLAPVRLWFAVYLAVMLVGGALFGDRWFAQADPFEGYSTLVGRLAVLGRRPDGTLVARSPLAGLDGVVAAPGLVAVVAVLLGSTGFDSFRESNAWLRFTQATELHVPTVETAVLLGFCGTVGLTFVVATIATGVGQGVRRAALPGRFAHSLVPIVVGYVVAHYLSYFVQTGQQTVVQLSDPMVTGADLLGTADWQVGYWLSSHPTLLAVTKVLAVLVGHVLGVVAAHDRATRLLPPRHQLTGQLPLLLLMVVYTTGGLYLLFSA